jgi:hypothetical protein
MNTNGMKYLGKPYDAETAPEYFIGGGKVAIKLWGNVEEVTDIAHELAELEETLERHKVQFEYGASAIYEIDQCGHIIFCLRQHAANNGVQLTASPLGEQAEDKSSTARGN